MTNSFRATRRGRFGDPVRRARLSRTRLPRRARPVDLSRDPVEPTQLLVHECAGERQDSAALPQRFGQLEEHAPYYERDFRAPVLEAPVGDQGEYEVRVTNGGRNAIYIVQNHPCDVVGWDGYCYPYAFNLDEFAPITGKLHQPPPAHATFEAPGAAFCAFVPRLFDYHPLAIPVPYNHSSVDCDEVLYYVSGNFMSRRGVEEGSITLHAAGAPHGPQPGAVEASLGKTSTDEIAVMVDTFAPLMMSEAASSAKTPSTSAPGSRCRSLNRPPEREALRPCGIYLSGRPEAAPFSRFLEELRMRHAIFASAVLSAFVLSGCGGSGISNTSGAQAALPAAPQFQRNVAI